MVGLFDECVEHTPRDTVIALTRRLRETQADLIVSIGGGTVIDTVKVALVCLAEGVDDVDAMSQWHMRVNPDGSRVTPQPRLPPCRQIAVPTTLSGAEFSDLGGCTDTRNGTKQGYTGTWIGAAAVILDPRITVHTPQRLWLSTGVRALDHAVESLCSINAQPLVDATSVRALSLLGRALTRYATDPQRPGRAAGCTDGRLAGVDGHSPHRLRRQPRPGPCAGRRFRRAARHHLLRAAAHGDALERRRLRAAAGRGGRGAGRRQRGRPPTRSRR